MPKLKCDACSCSYNKDYYCCLNGIAVGGEKATHEGATCCASFADRDSAITNYSQEPVASMDIGCEAVNCTHNSNCKCQAEEVCICGDHACNCNETKCSTFCCK